MARIGQHLDCQRTTPRQHQTGHVAQVVAGIGQQCQRIDAPAVKGFNDDKADVERNADGKGLIEIRRCVAVATMTVFVVVRVVVGAAHQETFSNPTVSRLCRADRRCLSFTASQNFGKWNLGGTPMRVLMTHCWVIDSVLLVIQ
ncbi:hypothetical protein GALL_550100 [mine drainage metagenome]|uniref:Uncharacterized protein n=1 Tax=mine drainage metagenome TaxID=410659 RepID=A0A1J5NXE4_9ZZZZ